MKPRVIRCGCGADYWYDGNRRIECNPCNDVVSIETDEAAGYTYYRNKRGQLVDRKPLRAEGEVRRAYAAGAGVAPMGLGMTRSGIKI